mmetsp:Transcript_7126/g.14004  ORF Transcript_7126/g.14004 Transcript_7126/m.14004 type:complete len:205 (+) Transcript_7126:1069-1683(+)
MKPNENNHLLKLGFGSSEADYGATERASDEYSPPLLIWIGPALACALAYALYNIFIKMGSASIHPVLGGVILQIVAAILSMLLLAAIAWQENGVKELGYNGTGVMWATFAGLAVGAAEFIYFFVSSLGVQATQSIPIVIGGSVMFGTVMGFLLLKETLTIKGWTGVLMISVGIAFVGTDSPTSSCIALPLLPVGLHVTKPLDER